METLSRSLKRWDPFRVAAATLGIVWLALAAALGYSAFYTQTEFASGVAAVAVLAIAGSAILYAWREPGA